MAGVLALLMGIHDLGLEAFGLFGTISVAILLCGCVCTSRILLDRHTPLQTLAGVVNGFIWVYLAILLLGFSN